MDLEAALTMTRSAIVRAEAAGFAYTAASMRDLVCRLVSLRLRGLRLSESPRASGINGATQNLTRTH